MAGGTIPHFQNDAGHAGDRHRREGIHVRRRQSALRSSACLSGHGRDGEKVCPYCSTLYRYDPALPSHAETRPEGCLYLDQAA